MRANPLSDRTRGLLIAAERKLTRLYFEPRITLSDEEIGALTALVSAAIRTDDANRAATPNDTGE